VIVGRALCLSSSGTDGRAPYLQRQPIDLKPYIQIEVARLTLK